MSAAFPPLRHTHTRSIASGIPLGGLGTGSVEIRDDGCFHDWEIFNNYSWSGSADDAPPEMWSEDAFFALRVAPDGEPPRVRLLYDDDKKSKAASGWHDYGLIYSYPFVRNVQEIEYVPRFPFADLTFRDDKVPVETRLSAFSPFIPFNAKDSALPLAFFRFRVRNTGDKPCDASVLFSLRNAVGYPFDGMRLRHAVSRHDWGTACAMTADEIDMRDRTAGSLCLGALDPAATVLPAWTDGRGLAGFPNAATPGMSQLWAAFRDDGAFADSDPEWVRSVSRRASKRGRGVLHDDRPAGWRWRAAVCQKVRLEPGEEREVSFFMTWHFPNHYHYLSGERLGHVYATWFPDAAAVADYGATHAARLERESRAFVEALYGGTLPPWFAASLNAQLTTFPQAFWWMESGEVAAWEGMACCQIIPNAHTPWSTFQPLLFFPELYGAMKRRTAAYSLQQAAEEAGGCCAEGGGCDGDPFLDAERDRRKVHQQERQADLGGWFRARWQKLGYEPGDFSPRGRAKGATGFLMILSATQLWRDYLWTGDRELLEGLWPPVRERIEGAIVADENGDGLPDGAIAFTTYDHWFPPRLNAYECTMWLAELRAGAAIAEHAGDAATAARFEEVCRRGAESFERLLWNGEYYDFCHDARLGRNDPGCLADQVSGHLYLRLCGLPPVHAEDRVRSALRAVFRYNRQFEAGLLNGADPRGRSDWRYFARYSERGDDEALAGQWVTPWTGTEYYVAAVMLAEGLVDEGMQVAFDVFERCAGQGLLFNHIECGEHYFRALAIWAMLPALLGMVYDAAAGTLTLAPKVAEARFRSVFILPGVWGVLTRDAESGQTMLRVESGALSLAALTAPGTRPVAVRVNGREVAFAAEAVGGNQRMAFAEGRVTLGAGDELDLRA